MQFRKSSVEQTRRRSLGSM